MSTFVMRVSLSFSGWANTVCYTMNTNSSVVPTCDPTIEPSTVCTAVPWDDNKVRIDDVFVNAVASLSHPNVTLNLVWLHVIRQQTTHARTNCYISVLRLPLPSPLPIFCSVAHSCA